MRLITASPSFPHTVWWGSNVGRVADLKNAKRWQCNSAKMFPTLPFLFFFAYTYYINHKKLNGIIWIGEKKKVPKQQPSPKAFLCFFFATRGQMIWMEMKARGYLGILFGTTSLLYYTHSRWCIRAYSDSGRKRASQSIWNKGLWVSEKGESEWALDYIYSLPIYWIEGSPAGRVGERKSVSRGSIERNIQCIDRSTVVFGSLWGAFEGRIYRETRPSYNTIEIRLCCHLHLYCLFVGMSRCVRDEGVSSLLPLPSHLHRYILCMKSRNFPPWWTLSGSINSMGLELNLLTFFPFFSLYCVFCSFSHRKIGRGKRKKWKRVLPLHYPHKRHWLSSKRESASAIDCQWLPSSTKDKFCMIILLLLPIEYNKRKSEPFFFSFLLHKQQTNG